MMRRLRVVASEEGERQERVVLETKGRNGHRGRKDQLRSSGVRGRNGWADLTLD